MNCSDDAEIERQLLGLFDFERQRFLGKKLKPFTLDRVRAALERLGHPEKQFQVIHIAGTKGKGSTALMLQHLMIEHTGRRTGLFTSPHLVSLRERIRIDGESIDLQRMKQLLTGLLELNSEYFGGDLTFFEILFLCSLLHFRDGKIPWAILETGLGGRLDATNALDSVALSVLTRMGLDHQEILGNSLEEITREKAGIIKGAPVIALKQGEPIDGIFSDAARERNSRLFQIAVPPPPADTMSSRWENAHLAVSSFQTLFPGTGETSTLLKRCLELKIPGRLQVREVSGMPLILDVAHNGLSIAELAAFLKKFPRPRHLCLAAGNTRDPRPWLEILAQGVDRFYFCELPGERPGHSPRHLLDCFQTLSTPARAEILTGDLTLWIRRVEPGTKIVCGSFYIVGEAMRGLEPT